MYKMKNWKKAMAAAVCMACLLTTGIDAGATATKTTDTTGADTKVEEEAQTPKSADNSLKSLKLSEGTLSPAFVYNNVKYSATVGADTNSIDVDAVVSDSSATIQSITGNTDLKEGQNVIKIVVAAENGNLATYTINVTKSSAAVDTDAAAPAQDQSDAAAPDAETPDTTPQDTEASDTQQAGNTEAAANVTPEGNTEEDTSDVTASDEYQFLQKSYLELNDKYTALKNKDTKLIAGLIIALAICLIVIINLLIRGRRDEDEIFDDEDDFEEDNHKSSRHAKHEAEENDDDMPDEVEKEFEEEPVIVKKKKTKEEKKKPVPQEEDEDDTFFDDDEEEFMDFEEEPTLRKKKKAKKSKKKRFGKKEDIFDDNDDFYDEEEKLVDEGTTIDDVDSSVSEDIEIMDLNDL